MCDGLRMEPLESSLPHAGNEFAKIFCRSVLCVKQLKGYCSCMHVCKMTCCWQQDKVHVLCCGGPPWPVLMLMKRLCTVELTCKQA